MRAGRPFSTAMMVCARTVLQVRYRSSIVWPARYSLASPVTRGPSDVRDAVDLDQRVARNAAGGRDRRAHSRLRAEAAAEDGVHAVVVLQVVQVDVDLEHLLH